MMPFSSIEKGKLVKGTEKSYTVNGWPHRNEFVAIQLWYVEESESKIIGPIEAQCVAAP